MTGPDVRLVRLIARRLTAALELREQSRADKRIDRIMRRVLRSDEQLEATFAAVQTLRDLDVVDRNEAAYLLDYILHVLQWSGDGLTAPKIEGLRLDSPEDLALLEAAISHDDLVQMETFYRSRGEYDLADLVVRDLEAYHGMLAEGELSIFDQKEDPKASPPEERSTDSREVMERLLALSSNESMREWFRTRSALDESLNEVTPATAVRVVQEARAIGALTFEEHLRLMDQVIADLVWEECHADRQYGRLERKRDALYETLGIKDDAREDEWPFEYRMVEARLEQRYNGLTAVVLRRFEEHQMANLLVNNPAEYERIRSS